MLDTICLKTGLYLLVDEEVYHCDMYLINDTEIILLKGFAPDTSSLRVPQGYHVKIVDGRLVPEPRFTEWFNRINPSFPDWESYGWVIQDTYERFEKVLFPPQS